VNKVFATRVIEENRRIALGDHRKFVDASGNLKPVMLLPSLATRLSCGVIAHPSMVPSRSAHVASA